MPLVHRVSALLTALVAGALVAAPVLAQGRGSIRGTVTTTEGHSPIYGARVAIASPARVAGSSEDGSYVLRDLPAGTYVLQVTALGRSPASDTVTISAGQSVTHDVALAPGSLMLSSVIVSATRTPVEAKQGGLDGQRAHAGTGAQSPARESQDLLREIPRHRAPAHEQPGGRHRADRLDPRCRRRPHRRALRRHPRQ